VSRVCVVGGGIIGLLSALELQAAGLEVTLLERTLPGRESSWAGGGILSPLYPWRYPEAVTPLAAWSQMRYPDLAETLRESTDVDPEWTRSGLLVLDPDEFEPGLAWAAAQGRRAEVVGEDDLRRLEPRLAHEGEALWMPDLAQIRNPRLVKALVHHLQGRVRFLDNTPVQGFEAPGGRLRALLTPAGRLACERAVICAGAWSGGLLSTLGRPPLIEPVRGQMLLFRSAPCEQRRIVLDGGRYLIPRRDGRVLAGSTMERVGFDKATTRVAAEALKAFAVGRFPHLEAVEMERHWSGLRPGSANGVPYIGPVPGVEGLFIDTGQFRNGVVLAPASARLVADLMLGRPPILDPAAYAVDAPRP